MNNTRITLIPACMMIILLVSASCKKETTPEALIIQKPIAYTDPYYVNLRAYKQSKHAVAFGWLADYPGNSGSASYGERFAGVPDSMDIVSLWGGVPQPKDSAMYTEMRFMQRVKGTKLVAPVFVFINNYPKNKEGILQFAAYLKKLVYDNELDGLDLDYEPDEFFSNDDNFITLVTALAQYLGPKSGTGKILDIDYYAKNPPAVLEPYIDYVIQQAYTTFSASSLQGSYNVISAYIPPEKYIVTENVGDYWANGGVAFTDMSGKTVPSIIGMAAWNPTQGQKGGFGAFYFQRDYYNTPSYKFMRAAIQACNPARH